MDQGTIVEPDDGRAWTPLRAFLIVLGAIAGGILLSIALGGPAHAESPTTPPQPAAATADASLVGRLTGALTDLTRTAVAPVDALVTTVAPRPAAPAAPASPTPIAAVPPSAGTIPVALDTALAAVPLSSTPLWQDVVGPQPAQQLVTPLAAVLRPLAPGVADLLAPVLPPAPPGAAAAAATAAHEASSDFPIAPAPVPLVRGPGAPSAAVAGIAASAVRHLGQPIPAPRAPTGLPDDAVGSVTSGGMLSPVVLVAFTAALLLLVLAVRRRGWTLPVAPVFGAEVSPD